MVSRQSNLRRGLRVIRARDNRPRDYDQSSLKRTSCGN